MFIILKHFFVVLFETQNIWQKKKHNEISLFDKTQFTLKTGEFGNENFFLPFLS